jgi:hypothetical protein
MLKAHETLSATLNDAHKCARLHPLGVYGHTPPVTRLDEIRHGYRWVVTNPLEAFVEFIPELHSGVLEINRALERY